MKTYISPGIIVSMLGTIGLVLVFATSIGEFGSKIPLTIFCIVLIGIGIAFEMLPREMKDETFGEREMRRGFG